MDDRTRRPMAERLQGLSDAINEMLAQSDRDGVRILRFVIGWVPMPEGQCECDGAMTLEAIAEADGEAHSVLVAEEAITEAAESPEEPK